MIISLDSETTGVDWAHGASPFLVTMCDEEGVVNFWEWEVDPLTRTPHIPAADITAITDMIEAADLIYMQNGKFDAHALRKIGIELPWAKVRDTLCMGHLLASNHSHKLDAMCVEYLGENISKYEKEIEGVVKTARAIVKKEYPEWMIADEGVAGMPSVKVTASRDEDKPWKNDMWLPRALIAAGSDHYIPEAWATACRDYANADSSHTLPLGLEMESLIRQKGLWDIYLHRLELPRVAYEMEAYGMTVIGTYTQATIQQYTEYTAEAAAELCCIASDHRHALELAEGTGINDNMRDFFYGAIEQRCTVCKYQKRIKHWMGEEPLRTPCPKCSGRKRKPQMSRLTTTTRANLALPVIPRSKGGGKKTVAAALDKEAMQDYLATTEGDANDFIRILIDKRKHDKDLADMESYSRFWIPIVYADYGEGFVPDTYTDYYRIHPSLNPFGTHHLRWSSNSPNLQNVGDQQDECEECEGEGGDCLWCNGTGKSRISVRKCFGPAPGREWRRMDYKNLEKRIPVYECMEPSLVEVFENPDKAPYWGSDHNVLASILFPEEFWPLADTEGAFKEKYKQKYKRTKNTNFAKQYGAGRAKVEATSGVSGAYELIERGLPRIAQLQKYYLEQAERMGYVETLPDRTVDAKRGYPILASRTEDGRILSTTPFNYHVSGTACWAKNTALIRCSAKCAEWRREGFDAHIALEIHDEILFDFPKGRDMEENRPRALILKKLMEQSGEDLIPRIPTPVNVEYSPVCWADGVKA